MIIVPFYFFQELIQDYLESSLIAEKNLHQIDAPSADSQVLLWFPVSFTCIMSSLIGCYQPVWDVSCGIVVIVKKVSFGG